MRCELELLQGKYFANAAELELAKSDGRGFWKEANSDTCVAWIDKAKSKTCKPTANFITLML